MYNKENKIKIDSITKYMIQVYKISIRVFVLYYHFLIIYNYLHNFLLFAKESLLYLTICIDEQIKR